MIKLAKERVACAYRDYCIARYLGDSVWVSLRMAWDALLGRSDAPPGR